MSGLRPALCPYKKAQPRAKQEGSQQGAGREAGLHTVWLRVMPDQAARVAPRRLPSAVGPADR